MSIIGPTFADELKAAGISGDGIAWGNDGNIEYREDVPQATRDAVAAVLAVHDPLTPPVPQVVTMRQARVALSRANKLSAVQSAVTAAGGETLIAWEYATDVRRTSPIVASIGLAAGLSSVQLDDLFRAAAALDA